MKVLIAEDDAVSRQLLESSLIDWGYDVITAGDGAEAWQLLQQDDAPKLLILDWLMPGLTGLEVIQKTRKVKHACLTYIILLTARGGKADVVEGLKAGANDYLTKPFDDEELQARVNVGAQMAQLQAELAARVAELEIALAQVKSLHGLLPICSWCKKIRDDKDYWHQVESYITAHSDAMFTHCICPACFNQMMSAVQQP